MPAFSVPLSGLDATSQSLTQIANNLANMNTPGFKSSTAEFTTLFYQNLGTSGSGNPIQEGTGATIGTISTDFTDGSISNTGINSNAAIQGSGFFVINQNGQQLYTRAGDFTVSSNGFLEAPSGAQVMGYAAVNGVVNPNGPLSSLQVANGLTSAPSATANIQMALNLNSNSAVGTTFSQPMQVFDSLGGNHTITATFTKTGANAWGYAVTLPGADTGAAAPTTLASGNVTFTSSGQLVPTAGSNPPALNVTLTSGGLANGAAALNMTWHLFDTSGNSLITQAAAASAPVSSTQDGFASGSLVDFTIQGDGTISGSFSNGQTRSLGQVALATFADQQGIQAVGNNAYASTVASGAPTIGVPGTGSRGTLQGGSIEQSNVDIAAQFAQLIQAQQGYEANAKTVTTFNTVTQATINMVTP